jgi:hypothetical protein
MTETERLALDYVRSIKGGPNVDEFNAQHEPLGPILLPKLVNTGLAYVTDARRILLTGKGRAALAEASL